MEILKLKDGTNIAITKEEADAISQQLRDQNIKRFFVKNRPIDVAMFSTIISEEEHELNCIIKSGGYICHWGWPHQRFEICGHDRMHKNPNNRYRDMMKNRLYQTSVKQTGDLENDGEVNKDRILDYGKNNL